VRIAFTGVCSVGNLNTAPNIRVIATTTYFDNNFLGLSGPGDSPPVGNPYTGPSAIGALSAENQPLRGNDKVALIMLDYKACRYLDLKKGNHIARRSSP